MSTSFTQRLILIHGKGGVGRTTVSRALACALAQPTRSVIWASTESDPSALNWIPTTAALDRMISSPSASFEELVGRQLKIPALARLLTRNRAVKVITEIAPGLRELLVLGKLYDLSLTRDHVVVDMPSFGYSLTMVKSPGQFARLFKGGSVHRHAEAMQHHLGSPDLCAHVIVAVPEEMPVREALEFRELLLKEFPSNPPLMIANRVFPQSLASDADAPSTDEPLFACSVQDYLRARFRREQLLLDAHAHFIKLPYLSSNRRLDRLVDVLR